MARNRLPLGSAHSPSAQAANVFGAVSPLCKGVGATTPCANR